MSCHWQHIDLATRRQPTCCMHTAHTLSTGTRPALAESSKPIARSIRRSRKQPDADLLGASTYRQPIVANAMSVRAEAFDENHDLVGNLCEFGLIRDLRPFPDGHARVSTDTGDWSSNAPRNRATRNRAEGKQRRMQAL